MNPITGLTKTESLSSQDQIPQKPTTFQATSNAGQNTNFKAIATRVVAGYLTIGLSEIVVSARTLLKLTAGYLITHTGNLDKNSRMEALSDFKENCPNQAKTSEKIAISTADSAKLDGMIIKPENSSNIEQKYVILVNGFGESYESKLENAAEYANRSGANILCFNYRGAGDSKGVPTSANDFVTDTLSMVEFLTKEKGIKPENIIIHGFSMGGGVGAQAAGLSDDVKHINDRSFSAFSKATKDLTTSHLKSRVGRKAAEALGSIAGGFIKGIGFELDTKKVYRDKNAAFRNDIEKRTLVVYHSSDNVISQNASLNHVATDQTRLSSHAFVDLSNPEVTYRPRVDSTEKLKLLGKEANDRYDIPTFEDIMALSRAGQKFTKDDYMDFLKMRLEKNFEDRKEQLKTAFVSEPVRQQLNKEINDLEGMLSGLNNIHVSSLFDSKEGTEQILNFIRGAPAKETTAKQMPAADPSKFNMESAINDGDHVDVF